MASLWNMQHWNWSHGMFLWWSSTGTGFPGGLCSWNAGAYGRRPPNPLQSGVWWLGVHGNGNTGIVRDFRECRGTKKMFVPWNWFDKLQVRVQNQGFQPWHACLSKNCKYASCPCFLPSGVSMGDGSKRSKTCQRHVQDMSRTWPRYMNHEHHGFKLQQFAEHSGLQAEGGAGAGSGVISVV